MTTDKKKCKVMFDLQYTKYCKAGIFQDIDNRALENLICKVCTEFFLSIWLLTWPDSQLTEIQILKGHYWTLKKL